MNAQESAACTKQVNLLAINTDICLANSRLTGALYQYAPRPTVASLIIDLQQAIKTLSEAAAADPAMARALVAETERRRV